MILFTSPSILSISFNYAIEEIEGGVETLSGSPWIAPALISHRDQDIAKANSVLDRYNSSLGVSVCYLINSSGVTIASSNRKAPDSFVGNSYKFRPYFTQAMKGNRGQYLALGVTSGKRGAFASYPVRDTQGKIVGVAVIKKDLDEIETYLSNYPLGFIVDPHGIIFLSSKKEMLLKSLWPINKEIEAALIASRQFGDKPFQAIMHREISNGMDVTFNKMDYYVSRKILNPEGWSLVLMAPRDKIFLYKSIGFIATILLCLLAIILAITTYLTLRSRERQRAEKALRKSEAKYYDLYDNAPDMYYSLDYATGTIKECNETFIRKTGYSKEELIGCPIFELYDSDSIDEAKEMRLQVQSTGEVRDAERRVKCKDGSIIDVSLNVSVIRDKNGNITHSRSIWRDITGRKRNEELIRALSITDQLTGLYNRRGFATLAEQQLRMAERTMNGIVLLFADVDGLKQINDKLGHKSGDEAIVEAANIFKEVCRKMDIIARMGGDEFAVLAPEASLEYSDMIKNRFQNRLAAQNARTVRDYNLSLSIGVIYHHPSTPSSLDALINRADSLMYEQKRLKKSLEPQRESDT